MLPEMNDIEIASGTNATGLQDSATGIEIACDRDVVGIEYDTLNEYCGVFGILDPNIANSKGLGQTLYYGLYALQHRGQESCGMAVFDNHQFRVHKDMGLVNIVFSESILANLTGQVGIGHTRYSTTGGCNLDNAQPVVTRCPFGALTLAHNGNLINTEALRVFLQERGFFGFGDSDSHLMVQYINYEINQGKSLKDSVMAALSACEGAFSLVIATGDTLIAARDRNGLRPFCMGKTQDGATVVASETCALDIVGAKYVRDIAPGEVYVVDLNGNEESLSLPGEKKEHLCVFELVYFARPDSQVHNSSVYNYRLNLGRRLAQRSRELFPEIHKAGAEADIVIPVPDSGNVAAVGYSQESGISYVEGLIKNRYVGRTFINPTQEHRERGIQLKLNPLKDILAGKRVVVVDDSIVRGNTSRKLVKMLRECGVKELHLRISSAPVRKPCFYGIDMSDEEQLIANKMDTLTLQQWLGVDSLVYLTPEDMTDLARQTGLKDPCDACFSGIYPAGHPDDYTPQQQPLSIGRVH